MGAEKGLDGASAPGTSASCSSIAKMLVPKGRCGRGGQQAAVIAVNQTAPGSPSLLSPSSPTSGREGSERRGCFCHTAEPHGCKTEP